MLTNQEHEQRARNKLGEELARLGHEWLRIRAEYACGGIGCWWDGANTSAS